MVVDGVVDGPSPCIVVAGVCHSGSLCGRLCPKQLTMDSQKDMVTVAICQVRKLCWSISMLFDRFLNYSCLDWIKVEEVDKVVVMLCVRIHDPNAIPVLPGFRR